MLLLLLLLLNCRYLILQLHQFTNRIEFKNILFSTSSHHPISTSHEQTSGEPEPNANDFNFSILLI